MIKKVAATVLSTLALSGGLTAAAIVPAHAASTTQKICSSKNSTKDVDVYSKSSGVTYILDAQDCVTIAKGGSVVYLGNSYRVGYGGDYSECRHNSGFTPYTGADNVYFRTYAGTNC